MLLLLALDAVVASEELQLPPAGEALGRRIAAGEEHPYRAELSGGEALLLEVEQVGIDVELEIVEGDGPPELLDGPYDRRARELALLEGAGRFRVVVRAREAGAPPG
ncbi:MAG: hypothetical protein MI919_08770, partial [Holophagales bacterium]|nr:hypothetical protein [Holophagales bacterium]